MLQRLRCVLLIMQISPNEIIQGQRMKSIKRVLLRAKLFQFAHQFN